jgi:hypothetical protein
MEDVVLIGDAKGKIGLKEWAGDKMQEQEEDRAWDKVVAKE